MPHGLLKKVLKVQGVSVVETLMNNSEQPAKQQKFYLPVLFDFWKYFKILAHLTHSESKLEKDKKVNEGKVVY